MVRLKEKSTETCSVSINKFQFLMVRLKVLANEQIFASYY